jgi:hypothetical protein
MMRVNWEKNSGFESIIVSGDSSTNFAFTLSLSSCNKPLTVFAFENPLLSQSTVVKTRHQHHPLATIDSIVHESKHVPM